MCVFIIALAGLRARIGQASSGGGCAWRLNHPRRLLPNGGGRCTPPDRPHADPCSSSTGAERGGCCACSGNDVTGAGASSRRSCGGGPTGLQRLRGRRRWLSDVSATRASSCECVRTQLRSSVETSDVYPKARSVSLPPCALLGPDRCETSVSCMTLDLLQLRFHMDAAPSVISPLCSPLVARVGLVLRQSSIIKQWKNVRLLN